MITWNVGYSGLGGTPSPYTPSSIRLHPIDTIVEYLLTIQSRTPGCLNHAHTSSYDPNHHITHQPISTVSNSLTPDHLTNVIHHNGELSERYRALESELSTARTRIAQLESLLYGGKDGPNGRDLNGDQGAMLAIDGIEGVRSESREMIKQGWSELMDSSHAGLVKLLDLDKPLVNTLNNIIENHHTSNTKDLLDAIDPSSPNDLQLVYSLVSGSLGHDSNSLDITSTLDLQASHTVLDQSSTLVAVSLCGHLPSWAHPALTKQSISSHFVRPHPKIFMLDLPLSECQPAIYSAGPPQMEPAFWFDAQDMLDDRWKVWRTLEEGASLDVERVLVIAGPITIGKERIAALHISTETRRITVFDTARWTSKAVKLVSWISAYIPSLITVTTILLQFPLLHDLTVME